MLIFILFRKELFIYKPEKLERANKFGIPSLHLMDVMLEKYPNSNTWPFVTVVSGLKEGKGVFAKINIPKYCIISNYGGYVEKSCLPRCKLSTYNCNYLFELCIRVRGKNKMYYLNHDDYSESVGKYINHSSRHSNLIGKAFIKSDGKPDVMFLTSEKVKKGTQLVWNYGKLFEGINPCVESCEKCKFLYKKCEK